jgi:hypothetical protein
MPHSFWWRQSTVFRFFRESHLGLESLTSHKNPALHGWVFTLMSDWLSAFYAALLQGLEPLHDR